MNREALIARLREARREIEPGQEVEVGLFRPEDALGVSLAYLEVYGDAFPIGHVYDPDEVVRRNATDDQYTIVARTPRGEVVGLAGLFRHAPNPDVYEGGQFMVLKQYRRSHVARDISREVMQVQARRLGLPVVFCEAVCNHPASQRVAFQDGLDCTGLALECMPAKTYEVEGGVSRNVSLLLMFAVLKPSPCAARAPEPYGGFLRGLWDRFGLVRETLAPQPLAGDTQWSEFLLPEAGLCRLTVPRAGADFDAVTAGAEERAETIQIFLNLGDPAVDQAVDLLRERGYFFGGLLPHWFGADGLVMQKTPREPDWDAIILYGKRSKAMCDMVRADRESVTVPASS
ncbi:GNAT family N-acetyltransferase [Pseudodesulfovibrio sp. F-1]|uniref:GNAT family N-acetyltransferase n=1 Tax=Pseudodesulfovibrio alkaliphilus TaxID=2661613 RepID=A0A7K1KKL9_9BACT|nr:GNAT family N-acetyltransferase [Pseudodesulfovibrio alkaliphilus]MUM76618.1 GNAT family N-acetyltransferase [Pseudodesulfovibrio alkaliphilus]